MVAKAAVITLTMVILFFAGTQPAKVAFVIARIRCYCSRGEIKPEKIYREIDWSLLLLFAGLFVVVAAFRKERGFGLMFCAELRHFISNE